MKNTGIKSAAALAVVALACGGYAVGASRAAQRKGTAVARGVVVDAHTVYGRNCARCHGEDGDAKTEQGELYGATDFTSAEWWNKVRPTDARLRRAISAGRKGGMPAFGRRLSPAEIDSLVAYVRGFRGK